MMNNAEKDELRIQALVDGELSEPEALTVRAWIAKDVEAKEVYESLKCLKALVDEAGELPARLPVQRDYFWARIQEGIAADSSSEESVPLAEEAIEASSWVGVLGRYLIPLLGALAIAIAVVLPRPESEIESVSLSMEHESESPSANYMSFRSESAGMTVIWLTSYNKDE